MLSEQERKQAIKQKGKDQREKNFMFSGIDWSKVIAIAPNGKCYRRPE